MLYTERFFYVKQNRGDGTLGQYELCDGMLKIVFVQKDVFAKPGIMALSASVKRAGHVCLLVVADLEKQPVQAILDHKPDVIAFSITTGEYPFMEKIGRCIRQRFNGRIICGGPHPTFYPEVLKDDYLDAICRGEGDDALPEYLNALERNQGWDKIQNMHVKQNGQIRENPLRPLISDLDSLPFYDRNLYTAYLLYRKKGHEILYHQVVMTGRGCPQSCSFCFNACYNALYQGKGPVLRRRSVEHIIRELRQLSSTSGPRFITFDDDSFTLAPQSWLDDFCETYAREIAIPFKINSTAGVLTESRVKALKKAGCHAVKIGLESGNEDLRNRILNKKVKNKTLEDAAIQLHKNGIRLQTFNMVGLPGETLDLALETYALNQKIKPDFAWCSLLNPYPGTAIHLQCERKGLLKTPNRYSGAGYSYFTQSPMAIPEPLIRLQKLMYVAVILRLSPKLVRRLVSLPLTRQYQFLFGIGMFWGLTRINKHSLINTLTLSLRYFSKYNHEH
ncbi:MAG: B12-binding domain-containing radical SAM protein [Proteobacteria bacterium]|nr:B12-binding domain-containing radical SAM protein [Pseudomonadota bacterium]